MEYIEAKSEAHATVPWYTNVGTETWAIGFMELRLLAQPSQPALFQIQFE